MEVKSRIKDQRLRVAPVTADLETVQFEKANNRILSIQQTVQTIWFYPKDDQSNSQKNYNLKLKRSDQAPIFTKEQTPSEFTNVSFKNFNNCSPQEDAPKSFIDCLAQQSKYFFRICNQKLSKYTPVSVFWHDDNSFRSKISSNLQREIDKDLNNSVLKVTSSSLRRKQQNLSDHLNEYKRNSLDRERISNNKYKQANDEDVIIEDTQIIINSDNEEPCCSPIPFIEAKLKQSDESELRQTEINEILSVIRQRESGLQRLYTNRKCFPEMLSIKEGWCRDQKCYKEQSILSLTLCRDCIEFVENGKADSADIHMRRCQGLNKNGKEAVDQINEKLKNVQHLMLKFIPELSVANFFEGEITQDLLEYSIPKIIRAISTSRDENDEQILKINLKVVRQVINDFDKAHFDNPIEEATAYLQILYSLLLILSIKIDIVQFLKSSLNQHAIQKSNF